MKLIDWIWGLALPLLTEIKRLVKENEKKCLIGISALPGCGKSTLGKWLQAAAKKNNCLISVLSLDDFYLPGPQLDLSMKGNPWNVPRGLPGSHSIELLEDTIKKWQQTGVLFAPRFDKSLRDGFGDRSCWERSEPKLLILEGWFLGCKPLESGLDEINRLENLHPPLNLSEIRYREKVQEKLELYKIVWEMFDRVWHIKAMEFSSTCGWKQQQEQQMYKEKGSSLKGDQLNSFIRMIQSAIPQTSLMNIESDVLVKINQSRKVVWVGLNKNEN